MSDSDYINVINGICLIRNMGLGIEKHVDSAANILTDG